MTTSPVSPGRLDDDRPLCIVSSDLDASGGLVGTITRTGVAGLAASLGGGMQAGTTPGSKKKAVRCSERDYAAAQAAS